MSAGRTPVPITVRTAMLRRHRLRRHALAVARGVVHARPRAQGDHARARPRTRRACCTSAIFDPDPCLFIETIVTYGMTRRRCPTGTARRIALGKADIKRPGNDVTIITYGRGVSFEALQAAERSAADGIDVEVVDLRTLVPLDMRAVLESVGRTRRAVVAHYATTFAGPAPRSAAIDRQGAVRRAGRAGGARRGAASGRSPALSLDQSVLPNAAGIDDARCGRRCERG